MCACVVFASRMGQFAGAISVNGSVRLEASRFESNVAQSSGGAVLVHSRGSVELLSSTFEENSVSSGGVIGFGITNLGGRVQCDLFDCIEVCTDCESEPTLAPTQPSVSPSSHDGGRASSPPSSQQSTRPPNKRRKDVMPAPTVTIIITLVVSLLLLCIGASYWRRRGRGQQQSGDEERQHRYSMINLPRDASSLDTFDEESERSQLDSSINWSLLENWPAPVLIVDHDMRIKSWSSGKFASSATGRIAVRAFLLIKIVCCCSLSFLLSGA